MLDEREVLEEKARQRHALIEWMAEQEDEDGG